MKLSKAIKYEKNHTYNFPNLLIFSYLASNFEHSNSLLCRLKIVKISFKCKQFFIQLRKELVSIDLIIIDTNEIFKIA